MSPRLGALLADSEQLRQRIQLHSVCTSRDLIALALDAKTAAARLNLKPEELAAFSKVFALAQLQSEGYDEARQMQMLDVLNAQGHLIMTRPRSDVHRQAFWHRAVNVWIVCPTTSRVLLGQRAVSKDSDPHKWTCACCRMGSGELSMSTAITQLAAEFSIKAEPEEQCRGGIVAGVQLAFMLKTRREITKGIFAGQADCTWVDVYLALLDEEIPVERLHLDVRAKQAACYVTIPELEAAWQQKSDNYVTPPDEYSNKLLRYIKTACKE